MLRQSISRVSQKLRMRWQTLTFFDLDFLLLGAQQLFIMMNAFVIFEILGLPGILLNVVSLGLALTFYRLFGKILARVLRRHLSLIIYLIFQMSLFGLIGVMGLGLENAPPQSIYFSLGLGQCISLFCFLQSYSLFTALQETYKLGFNLEKLNETFMQIPTQIREKDDVLQGYATAFYVVQILFSSREYTSTVITIGSIIQKLLDVADRSKNVGTVAKAKRIGLNVSFGEVLIHGKTQSFDIEYFWHNVRSKYAHLATLSRYGLEEPSEEIARKSVGLLGKFLKAYPQIIGSRHSSCNSSAN